MNEFVNDLNPRPIWKNFASLLNIPRPSKKEESVIAFMKSFGEDLGLETIVDETGNVIIKKPAFPGKENLKGVILQGHLDMVPQKNSDKVHNFETDPIEAVLDGEWLKANGTTLGADNGMGVAAAMAILESKDIAHGPVEALFTIDEETGMTGAFNLKAGMLDGEILLNLDSEDEGELYVGCAGGTNANITFSYGETALPAGWQAWKLIVKGLKGGHSGLDINLGRGNANKLMIRFLKHAMTKLGVSLASIEGGSLRNAIPREAFAVIAAESSQAGAVKAAVQSFFNIYKKELSLTEPFLEFNIEDTSLLTTLIDNDTAMKLVHAVYACPNGVIRMSDSLAGLVETSTNLAIVRSGNGSIAVHCLLRSSVDSAKEDLEHMIASVFELAGAKVVMDGQYPGWKPNPDSTILNVMSDTYKKHYGKVPEVKAIHAGLECGILGGNYPHWDMISFGPTIRFPHSPDEKVNIPSVEKFYTYLKETLQNIPSK